LTGLRQARTLPQQLLHLAPDPGDLWRRGAIPEDIDSYLEDWKFHQASGMVPVQIGTWDMVEAAIRLIAAARALGKSPHDAALLVIDRQVRVG